MIDSRNTAGFCEHCTQSSPQPGTPLPNHERWHQPTPSPFSPTLPPAVRLDGASGVCARIVPMVPDKTQFNDVPACKRASSEQEIQEMVDKVGEGGRAGRGQGAAPACSAAPLLGLLSLCPTPLLPLSLSTFPTCPLHLLSLLPTPLAYKFPSLPSLGLPRQMEKLGEEGIMVKALDSYWIPDDRSNWSKMKPDYIKQLEIDAVVVGGWCVTLCLLGCAAPVPVPGKCRAGLPASCGPGGKPLKCECRAGRGGR